MSVEVNMIRELRDPTQSCGHDQAFPAHHDPVFWLCVETNCPGGKLVVMEKRYGEYLERDDEGKAHAMRGDVWVEVADE